MFLSKNKTLDNYITNHFIKPIYHQNHIIQKHLSYYLSYFTFFMVMSQILFYNHIFY
jgi:hypothetical protein